MVLAALIGVVLMLSFANGANDNFKGVATLFGTGTSNYRKALWWATCCTLLGSLTAAGLAANLLKTFSGKGLVSEAIVSTPTFAAAVACGAGLTVLIATRFGLPISTTHGLLGALVGAGLAGGSPIQTGQLSKAFVVPLMTSPLLALLASVVLYPILSRLRQRLGVVPESCLCVESAVCEPAVVADGTMSAALAVPVVVTTGTRSSCPPAYSGRVLGLEAQSVLDHLHFLSAGLVSFARGLNDTPKIAAVMLVGLSGNGIIPIMLVGICMACGGILRGQRVAETMSLRITEMNHGQGFTANALAGTIVIAASWLGLPVSTTHVMCGSLFGIGLTNGRGRWRTIGGIAGAWLITLPVGICLGASSFWAISRLTG